MFLAIVICKMCFKTKCRFLKKLRVMILILVFLRLQKVTGIKTRKPKHIQYKYFSLFAIRVPPEKL